MCTVYILYSLRDEGLYVGCTMSLEKRLKEHNVGRVLSTKNRRPLELIHKEELSDKGKAFNRERFLKSLWSGRFKKKLKKEYELSRAKSFRTAK